MNGLCKQAEIVANRDKPSLRKIAKGARGGSVELTKCRAQWAQQMIAGTMFEQQSANFYKFLQEFSKNF